MVKINKTLSNMFLPHIHRRLNPNPCLNLTYTGYQIVGHKTLHSFKFTLLLWSIYHSGKWVRVLIPSNSISIFLQKEKKKKILFTAAHTCTSSVMHSIMTLMMINIFLVFANSVLRFTCLSQLSQSNFYYLIGQLREVQESTW